MAGDGISKDELLALNLALGATVAEAAALAKVSERTARRRLALPEFRRRVSEVRGEALERATSLCMGGMSEGVQAMRALLGADSEQVRLGAARSLVQLGLALRQAAEIEARLLALEAAAGNTDTPEKVRNDYREATDVRDE